MREYLLFHDWDDDDILFLTLDEGEEYIDGDATHNNIQIALDDIRDKSTENDIIFIFLKNYGGIREGHHFFCTYGDDDKGWDPNNYWSADSLADELNNINYMRLVLDVSFCNSGGFVQWCAGPNRLITASTQEDQDAYGGLYVLSRGLINAPPDYLVDDGFVSVEEAFAYERDNLPDYPEQNPVFNDQIEGETFL